MLAGSVWRGYGNRIFWFYKRTSERGQMKQVTLKVSNCSAGQWSTLLLELYGVARTWKRFGPVIELQAPSVERIIKLGTSNKPQASKELIELTSSKQ